MAIGQSQYPVAVDTVKELVEAANDAQTTLTAPLGIGDTTAQVSSTARFSNSGFFAVGAELLSYDGKTPTLLQNLTHGVQGTTPAGHNSGDAVEQLITARDHNVLAEAIIELEKKVGVGDALTQRIKRTAGETLSGHRAVKINGSGEAVYVSHADADADLVTGLTTGAAVGGGQVEIVTDGELIEPSWTWTPGPVYLSTNGQLTQTPPASGALIEMGIALAATRLLVRIQSAVFQ